MHSLRITEYHHGQGAGGREGGEGVAVAVTTVHRLDLFRPEEKSTAQ